jgi:rhodanese-related sulfurtransferase
MSEKFTVISVEQLRKLDGQDKIFVDVRSPAEYRSVRVQGAVNLPLNSITCADVKKLIGEKQNPAIVLLCGKGGRARKAAEILQAGSFNLLVVEGGTNACVDANIPTEKGGAAMISIERQVRIGAGSLVCLGLVLGHFVNPYFYFLSAFIGAGLVFAGVTDWCGMGLLIARAPWNK